MNKRQFTIMLLASALPFLAMADSGKITLNSGDFISAERAATDEGSIVKVRLSKAGKAKFRKLNTNSVNKDIHAEIAGVTSDFKLREPIKGDSLQMGPYSAEEAAKVVSEINRK